MESPEARDAGCLPLIRAAALVALWTPPIISVIFSVACEHLKARLEPRKGLLYLLDPVHHQKGDEPCGKMAAEMAGEPTPDQTEVLFSLTLIVQHGFYS